MLVNIHNDLTTYALNNACLLLMNSNWTCTFHLIVYFVIPSYCNFNYKTDTYEEAAAAVNNSEMGRGKRCKILPKIADSTEVAIS